MGKISAIDWSYQAAKGLVQEVRLRDPWVYCTSEGNLPGQGGSFLTHYIGRKRFADDFLMFYDRDTVGAAVKQDIRATLGVPRFLRERSAAQACPQEADVLIVDHLFELGSGSDWLTLAPHINAMLPVMPTMDAQLELIRSKGHRRKLQAALKRGFTWRKTHSLADFNLFYDIMYEPFVHERFAYGASVVPRAAMQRMFTQRGFLLLVEEDGVPVSGALIYTSRRDRGVMNYWKYGLANVTELSPNTFGERNAAQEACVLQYAVDNGFREVDWGLTRAVPTDGIFVHKKRMGCDFRTTPGAPNFRVLINPKSRSRLLSRFPLVVSDSENNMLALMAYEPRGQKNELEQLAENLRGASFASLTRFVLFVPQPQALDPQVVATLKAVEAEVKKPVVVHPMEAQAPEQTSP